MRYYVKERQPTEANMRNAANKARTDVEMILSEMMFQEIKVIVPFQEKKSMIMTIKEHISNYFIWKKQLAFLKEGDILLIQFPIKAHTVFFNIILNELKKKKVCVVFLIHDLEKLRYVNAKNYSMKKKIRMYFEETIFLENSSYIIAHNKKMKQYLIQNNICSEKIIELDIFDYILSNELQNDRHIGNNVIIAGNLNPEKVGYLREINKVEKCIFELFGVGYKENDYENVVYNGSYSPEELPNYLKGSYGLIWDGDTIETCSGVYGNYLMFNNPHKTSLYLACGYPVIIWEKAALADFVIENQVGIVVRNLNEVGEKLEKISGIEYDQLCVNVAAISEKLRNGFYLKTAVNNIIKKEKEQNAEL